MVFILVCWYFVDVFVFYFCVGMVGFVFEKLMNVGLMWCISIVLGN